MTTVKKLLFWAITLLLPLMMLGGLELILRLTGSCAPEPLVMEVPESHGEVLQFNRWVARRYFDSTRTVLPSITPETFTRERASSTLRILCLGESSTAGFPFEGQVPFPAQLREILTRAYPDRRVEVLNAGVSAISSYVVLDMLPELLERTRPDLVIAYLGHNEFYGVYGSGSTLLPTQKRFWTLAALRLGHLHLAELVKRIVRFASPRHAGKPDDRTLMQAVIGNQDIALGSPEYRATMEGFRANLDAIADLCRAHEVRLIMGSLVSNEADQPPFHRLTGPQSAEAERLLAAGDSLLAAGVVQEAEALYRKAFAADTGNADIWFALGRVRRVQGDSTGALAWFVGAKDRDAMRFRASEEANGIIKASAAASGAGFVDLVGAFRHSCPGGVIGSTLLCDHLHPTPQGYYLMASSFFQAIQSMHVFPAPDAAFAPAGVPYGVTDLDWEIGLVKIFPMLHDWPFKKVRMAWADYRPHGDSAATRIAAEYLRGGVPWARAHDRMAHLYLDRGNIEGAKREFLAVAAGQPDDPWPYQQIAILYGEEKNWPLRSAALEEALMRSPVKGMIAYQLALAEYQQGHLRKAIHAMEFASGAPEFKLEERENARFYLAGFLSDAGDRDRARQILHALLAENPSYVPARKFLSQLERAAP